MDIILLLKAALMGLVEGITEFLPISSTGHLILTGQLLDFWTPEKRDMFSVAVQIGAIAAVIYEYWGKLWGSLIGALTGNAQGRRLSINLIVATIPIMLIGLTFGETLKAYLFNAVTVAIALIVGGFIIIWAERRQHTIVSHEVDDFSLKQALLIGLIQCFALIPGTSRSGSTIIGSLFLGISRKAAAEFSFFLGIPVLMGAGLLDMYKMRHDLHSNDLEVLAVGIVVAFVSALVVIRALIRYVSKHNFMAFAYYRIVFGLFILLTWFTGWVHW
ncbi:undecaprenyl-diphosphate phosphatase [Acinetobacter rathckeae]|uniref:undecaprenyl-diphosphate phosphatase n=1 Tax=Acinetobacter rathckeae TaxID=2605272 RepID=UPI0018A2ABE9|nr:undecaprenyl-diphosphate phosphatase [Acinetobacter rathckeae]MBF7688898.1 undecaprenyl-diphosphate phosphatase [Acinetobacter rathckeae]MBF7696697.1 undecaprenyl-diphosphate phosphatase [Acinetobacter rathckeae]